jgi:tetratricopeptide (TPR) repeat protein
MRDEHLNEQIADFLRGDLSEAEEAAFRERMENDPALEAEVDRMRAAMLAAHYQSVENMRKRMAVWNEQNTGAAPPVEKPAGRIWPWLRWGATLLIVVAGVWWFTRPPESVQQPPIAPPTEVPPATSPAPIAEAPAPPAVQPTQAPPEPRLLAADFARRAHQPFGENAPLRGATKEKNTIDTDRLSRAKKLLRSGLRQDAGQALRLLDACDECDATTRNQWRGHALFQLGRYAEALSEYQAWHERFQSEEAQWYMFLSATANDKRPADVYATTLAALQNPEHRRHQSWLELEAKMTKAGIRH